MADGHPPAAQGGLSEYLDAREARLQRGRDGKGADVGPVSEHELQRARERRAERQEEAKNGYELRMLASQGWAEDVKRLLEVLSSQGRTADVNSRGRQKPQSFALPKLEDTGTALHLAARLGCMQTIMELLLAGADANVSAQDGIFCSPSNSISIARGFPQGTPLYYASTAGAVAILKDPQHFIRKWREVAALVGPARQLPLSLPPSIVMRGLPLLWSGWNGDYHVQQPLKNGLPVWHRPAHRLALVAIIGVSIWWEPERRKWVLHRDGNADSEYVLECLRAGACTPVGEWQCAAVVSISTGK